MTTTKSFLKKKSYDLPVSRKFYQDLMSRLDDILREVFGDSAADHFRSAKRMIDCYLNNNLEVIPQTDIISEVNIIFLSLKAEINRARQRSLRARKIVRHRRANRAREAEISSSETASNPRVTPSSTAVGTVAGTSTVTVDKGLSSEDIVTANHVRERPRHISLKWKPTSRRSKNSSHPYHKSSYRGRI